jgi:hypothetical protein
MSMLTWGVEVNNPDKPSHGTWDFKLRKNWEISQLGGEMLVRVTSLKTDSQGNIFFYDHKQCKLFGVNSQGNLIFAVGRNGEGPGEFSDMFAWVFLTDTGVVVCELNRNQLHFFSKKGEFIRTDKTVPQRITAEIKIFQNVDEFLYQIEDERDKSYSINIFNLKSGKTKEIIHVPGKNDLEIKGLKNKVILDPRFSSEMLVAATRDDIIYGYSDCYEINRISWLGEKKITFSLKNRQKRFVSQEEKKKEFSNPVLDKKMVKSIVNSLPDYANYFQSLVAFDNGFVYVFLPVFGMQNELEIDIFSDSGNFMYRAKIKITDLEKVSYYRLDPGKLIVSGDTADGELKIISYSITCPSQLPIIGKGI